MHMQTIGYRLMSNSSIRSREKSRDCKMSKQEPENKSLVEEQLDELYTLWENGELNEEKMKDSITLALRHIDCWEALGGLRSFFLLFHEFMGPIGDKALDEKERLRLGFLLIVLSIYLNRLDNRLEFAVDSFADQLSILLDFRLAANPGNWKEALLTMTREFRKDHQQFPNGGLSRLRMCLEPELSPDDEIYNLRDLELARQQGYEIGYRAAVGKQQELHGDMNLDNLDLD
jgi:hypothetical protein